MIALLLVAAILGVLPDGTPCRVVSHRLVDGNIEIYLPEAGDWVEPAYLLVDDDDDVIGAELAGGAMICFAKGKSA